jgi:hypothetical protein
MKLVMWQAWLGLGFSRLRLSNTQAWPWAHSQACLAFGQAQAQAWVPVKIGSSQNEANWGRLFWFWSIKSRCENSNHNFSIVSWACNYIKRSYNLCFEHCTNESKTWSVFLCHTVATCFLTSTISFLLFSLSPSYMSESVCSLSVHLLASYLSPA